MGKAVTPSEHTERCWPTETLDELRARIVAEHGEEVWRVVERDLDREHALYRKPPAERVGEQERRGPAIPISRTGMTRDEHLDVMKERDARRFEVARRRGRRSPLPWSGAPSPPKRRDEAD